MVGTEGLVQTLTNEVLPIGREALRLGDVVVELLDVALLGAQFAPRDEAEDLHVAVVADVQVPGLPLEVNGAHRIADGPDLALLRQPRLERSASARPRCTSGKSHRTYQIISS